MRAQRVALLISRALCRCGWEQLRRCCRVTQQRPPVPSPTHPTGATAKERCQFHPPPASSNQVTLGNRSATRPTPDPTCSTPYQSRLVFVWLGAIASVLSGHPTAPTVPSPTETTGATAKERCQLHPPPASSNQVTLGNRSATRPTSGQRVALLISRALCLCGWEQLRRCCRAHPNSAHSSLTNASNRRDCQGALPRLHPPPASSNQVALGKRSAMRRTPDPTCSAPYQSRLVMVRSGLSLQW